MTIFTIPPPSKSTLSVSGDNRQFQASQMQSCGIHSKLGVCYAKNGVSHLKANSNFYSNKRILAEYPARHYDPTVVEVYDADNNDADSPKGGRHSANNKTPGYRPASMLIAYDNFFGKMGGASGGAGGQPPKKPTLYDLPADATDVQVHRTFEEIIKEIRSFPPCHTKHRQILKEIAKNADKYSENQIKEFKKILRERIADRDIVQSADWKKLSGSHHGSNTRSGQNTHRVR